MAPQFIFTTYKLGRYYPPDRQVLADISLSFYPGAKIGVLGANGSGKSSLLRIMAGEDDGFSGEARLTPGFSVGHLAQEPGLDPAKDVLGNVMDGVGEIRSLLDRYNEVLAMWGDPEADYEKVGAEQAELEDKINAAGAWDVERNVEIAMDALRCPPGDTDVSVLSGGERRRRRALSTAPLPAGLAAPRRAHQPPRRRVGRVARAVPAGVSRHRRRRHPRSVLPRQRCPLDPRARPRAGHPVRRELLVVARAEAGAACRRGEADIGAAAHVAERARVGADGTQGPAGEREGAPQCVREAARRSAGGRGRRRPARDLDPSRQPARRHGDRGRRRRQGLRRPPPHRGSLVLVAARGHRRRHRPERCRQDDALPHAHRRRVARHRAR